MHKLVNGVRIELSDSEIRELQTEWEINQKESDITKYQRERVLAYPSIPDQLGMLYDAMKNGELPKAAGWFDAITEVKEAYPKPLDIGTEV